MGKKLLVADDSLTIQKVIKLALSHDGYEIQTVADGNDLLAQLSMFRPDVLLIDLGLPGRSTFDLKRELNDTHDLRDIPIVLMASAFEKVDEAKVGLLGFDGRLTKPFDPSHLREVLAKAVNTRGPASPFESADIPPAPHLSNSVPASTYLTPDPTDSLQLNDPIWNSADFPQDLGLAGNLPPPPDPSGYVVMPDPTEGRTTESTYPDFRPDEKTDEVRLSMRDFRAPTSAPAPDTTAPFGYSSSALEDSDIRSLTESTVKMSGLEDLGGWNINEPSRTSIPPIPSIFEQDRPESPYRPSTSETRMQNATPPRTTERLRSNPAPSPSLSPTLSNSRPNFPSGPSLNLNAAPSATSLMSAPTPVPSRLEEMMADLPTSKDIEEMVEKQVRAQLEEILKEQVTRQVNAQLERMAKQAIPDLAERIVKQEIRKLLEGLP